MIRYGYDGMALQRKMEEYNILILFQLRILLKYFFSEQTKDSIYIYINECYFLLF